MKDQGDLKNHSKDKETSLRSRPRMCGTLLLWIGAEKMKQLQQNQVSIASDKETSELE